MGQQNQPGEPLSDSEPLATPVVSPDPSSTPDAEVKSRPDSQAQALPPRLSTVRIYISAAVMLFTYFLGSASTLSVTILIPSIARELGETELQTSLQLHTGLRMASLHYLKNTNYSGLLFAGRLADILGRKKLFLVGLVLYGLLAIITGVLRNRIGLGVTRAISGLGLSISAPAGFGILGANIRHEPARTIAFAASGLGMPVGCAFGLILGGLMANIGSGSWSYLFFLLGGFALFLLAVGFFIIPTDPPSNAGGGNRIDWIGGFLITAGLCLFTFSLTESGIAPNGWRSIYVPALLVTSIVLITLFVFWSLHLEHRTSYPPIVNISLFTRRHGLISVVCGCGLFSTICVIGWAYTTAIFYQTYKGLSPFQNSIMTLPAPIVGAIAAGVVMYLASRIRAPYLMGGGMALTATCSVMYALRPETATFWALDFPAQIIHPWGVDFIFGLGNILISNLVNQSEQSVGGALFQMSGQLGSALGTCLCSLISSEVTNKAEGDVLLGLRAAFWFSGAAGLMAMLLALIGLGKVRLAKDVGQIWL